MKFYSTNHNAPEVSFEEALLQGQAPDRGLYMPKVIPRLEEELIQSFSQKEYYQIAYDVTSKLIDGEVPEDALKEIVKDAYNYPVPLVELEKKHYLLKLDQGPTASFKDFAARMMARLMQYFLKKRNKRLVILTATSGDTGGAVADAFYGMENIDVIILYPKNEISTRQRKQMTTLGKNVTAIGLDAKFDNCQALVKEAFADPDLKHIPLSSANSINFGRLLPQTVYYFYAYSQTGGKEKQPVIFSVPSGNFGDLMGGVIAREMGLPVERFVVAVNENDEFVKFLESGVYEKIVPSRNCLSSAMNVGHPSNLARLIDLYGGHLDEKGTLLKQPDMEKMRKDFWAISINDEKTRETIKEVFEKYNYVIEPHGAVAWAGLQEFLKEHPTELNCIAFETADPAKFPEQIRSLTGVDPELPPKMKEQQTRKEELITLSNSYEEFKKFLLERYGKE